MAQRRMISKSIINSARFLKMPVDTQALYFHLCLNADDDGVVEAWQVMKQIGSSEDNLRVLASKALVRILNDDLVSLINDWNVHNQIRADRKIDSIYKKLLLQIVPDIDLIEPKERSDVKDNSKRLGVDGPRTDDGPLSIGKDRVGEGVQGETTEATASVLLNPKKPQFKKMKINELLDIPHSQILWLVQKTGCSEDIIKQLTPPAVDWANSRQGAKKPKDGLLFLKNWLNNQREWGKMPFETNSEGKLIPIGDWDTGEGYWTIVRDYMGARTEWSMVDDDYEKQSEKNYMNETLKNIT